ncbi:two-component regulator propeller domain-containing protein [Fulvivirgaceae bacterium BMA12]|uniref:Two-component regulator propeller domain-containing protein n=1 Tax=Agaribacillus aureus TaxID=3051825 RepID=A0ABT8L2E7_9BACT|nr:two-component regulator propeller domain-containing protein [Fulvivirgaceae bacterium BMA12]
MEHQINKIKTVTFRIGGHIIHLLAVACLILFTACRDDDSGALPSTIHLEEAYHLETMKTGNFIVDFQFAKDEILWVGTFNGGIFQLSGTEVKTFNTANSPLPDNHINDLFIDHLDRLWIATGHGFAMYDKGHWEVYTSANAPLAVDHVSEIAVNKKNEILLGNGNVIDGGLLFRSESGNWKAYTDSNSKLPCNVIHEIEIAPDGSFWISTAQFHGKGGIVKFENEDITEVLSVENSGLLYNFVDNIEITDRDIWIGYEVAIFNQSGFPDGGIQQIDFRSSSPASYFPNEKALVSNRITAMKLDVSNSLWFATGIDDPACENCFAGIGVLLENKEILAISASKVNLPPNAFFTKLNGDNHGNMYVAHESSLYRLKSE